MAKKNITFRIDEDLIEKFNELRGGLSQNAFLAELITSKITSTSNLQVPEDLQVKLQVLIEGQERLEQLFAGKITSTSNLQVSEEESEEESPIQTYEYIPDYSKELKEIESMEDQPPLDPEDPLEKAMLEMERKYR